MGINTLFLLTCTESYWPQMCRHLKSFFLFVFIRIIPWLALNFPIWFCKQFRKQYAYGSWRVQWEDVRLLENWVITRLSNPWSGEPKIHLQQVKEKNDINFHWIWPRLCCHLRSIPRSGLASTCHTATMHTLPSTELPNSAKPVLTDCPWRSSRLIKTWRYYNTLNEGGDLGQAWDLGVPQNRPWNESLSASSLFGKWSQGTPQEKWRCKTGKGSQPIKYI